MSIQTTYTVVDPDGTVLARGVTATDAAEIILTDDGHTYEIRPHDAAGNGHDLYISRGSRNNHAGLGGLTQAYAGDKPIYSQSSDARLAWLDIAEQVIMAGWGRVPEAITDAEYDALPVLHVAGAA